MEEITTDAIVLHTRPHGEHNKIAELFTQELGKIEARVVSGLKTNSKLSPHLDPLNMVTLRLVKRNNFVVADALTKSRFNKTRNDLDALGSAFATLYLLRFLLPSFFPEPELWNQLIFGLRRANLNPTIFLKALGYSPLLASCSFCRHSTVHFFYIPEQLFICERCVAKISEEHFLVPVFPSLIPVSIACGNGVLGKYK